METKEQNSKEKFKQLFRVLEDTFARPLSPYEIETLNQWIDVDKTRYCNYTSGIRRGE